MDRELYVPRSWTSDPDRCLAAGLGKETSFATKPELAARMVAQFLDAGPPGRLGRGRRGLRRQPHVESRAGGTRHRLRPRGGLRARSHYRRRAVPRRRSGHEGAQAGLAAEALLRGRGEGRPLLRLGRHRSR
ncbi:transposase [Streptomyces tibetensis]